MPETKYMLRMLKAAHDLLTNWRSARREDCLSAIAFLRKYGDTLERELAESVAHKLVMASGNPSNGSNHTNGNSAHIF